VQARGKHDEDPVGVLVRHGLLSRDQVVTRLDPTPRDLVERWGGSPLGVRWEGRSTVRRRLGPRTPIPGVYAAGAHATPGAGLPFTGLSASLVAQVVGAAD
jgi:UDP-galactopyranose mutase